MKDVEIVNSIRTLLLAERASKRTTREHCSEISLILCNGGDSEFYSFASWHLVKMLLSLGRPFLVFALQSVTMNQWIQRWRFHSFRFLGSSFCIFLYSNLTQISVILSATWQGALITLISKWSLLATNKTDTKKDQFLDDKAIVRQSQLSGDSSSDQVRALSYVYLFLFPEQLFPLCSLEACIHTALLPCYEQLCFFDTHLFIFLVSARECVCLHISGNCK